jgi:hypothetical protein
MTTWPQANIVQWDNIVFSLEDEACNETFSKEIVASDSGV